MPAEYYSNVRRRFIATVIFVVLIMGALFWWQASRERELVISAAGKDGASYTAALSEHADRVFAEVDSSLKELVEYIEQQGGVEAVRSPSFSRSIQERVKNELQFSSIYVLDREGTRLAHTLEDQVKPVNLSSRSYFKYHRDKPGSGLFISAPYVSSSSNDPHFNVSRAIRGKDGRFDGLVSLTVQTSYFDSLYKGMDVGPHGRIILATTGGDVLSCVPQQPTGFNSDFKVSPLITQWLPAASYGVRQDEASAAFGEKRLDAYRKLDHYPVVTVISYSQDDVLAAWRGNLQKQGVIAVVLTLLALSISWLFLRQLKAMESSSLKLQAHQAELLLKSELLDTASDAVLLLDREANFIYFNKALQLITGYSAEELQAIGLHGMEPPEYAARIKANIELLVQNGEAIFESAYLCKSGNVLPIEVHARFLEVDGQQRVLSVVRDITSRKSTEQALIRAEQREHVRAEMLEQIASGKPLPDQLTQIVTAIEKEHPDMICSILQVSEDGTRLVSGAAPSLPEFYNKAANRTKIGEGIGSCGTAAFRRERVIVEDIDCHPFWKGFSAAQQAGLRSCWSEPIISSAGQLLGTFAIYHRAPAVPSEDEIYLIQQAAAFAGIAIERSKGDSARMELEHLLSQAQKMEAIGHLSGGIAHDFNNLLTPILIYSDLLKRSLPDNEKVQSQLDGIIKASGKARDLTQQLLSFGRKQVLQIRVVNLNDIIMSFHSMVRRTLRENISFSLNLSSQPVVIRADSSKIEQVLLNLVLNAQDAIAVNGSISLETGVVLIDDEFARRHPGMNPGKFVAMSCRDNGCGMAAETMSRIFEPFFSTKEVGHGTGLGLANVYGIVKQHNGYILPVSTVGVGTTFTVFLPLCEEQPQIIGFDHDQNALDHSGNAVILLVEDNEMVRVMSSDLLEGLGYTVYSAEHPEHALALLPQITEKIDLVITDVVMPGMNGQQLFEKISADHPEINKVLYMSGYTNNVIVTDGKLDDGLHFLQKPFTVDALMAKVKELLGSSPE